MSKIEMPKPIAQQLARYFADQPVERGCLVGSSRYLNRIDHFAPVPGIAGPNQFTPDMDAVNTRIAVWRDQGICFCGFFHSHPGGPVSFSDADRSAIESWVRSAGLPFLCFGLSDGSGTMALYLAEENDAGQVVIRSMRQCPISGFSRYYKWRVVHE